MWHLRFDIRIDGVRSSVFLGVEDTVGVSLSVRGDSVEVSEDSVFGKAGVEASFWGLDTALVFVGVWIDFAVCQTAAVALGVWADTAGLGAISMLEQKSLHKNWSFQLRISSVNVTKSVGNYGFGFVYWRNLYW